MREIFCERCASEDIHLERFAPEWIDERVSIKDLTPEAIKEKEFGFLRHKYKVICKNCGNARELYEDIKAVRFN